MVRASKRSYLLRLFLSLSLLLSLCASCFHTDSHQLAIPALDLYSDYLEFPFNDYPYDDYELDYVDPDLDKTDRYIVKYKEGSDNAFKTKLSNNLVESRSIDSLSSVFQTETLLPDNNSRGETNPAFSSRFSNTEVLILSEKMLPSELEELLVALGATGDIDYIQPDYELEIASISSDPVPPGEQGTANETGPPSAPSLFSPPSQSPSFSPSPSSSPVIIAIIDTGVDTNHPAYSSYLHPATPDVYDPSDPYALSHGTHIAGIIAGEASCYGANIQILALPVFSNGTAYTSDIIAAIEVAEALGASVVNCSFGSSSYNQALYEAMEDSSVLFICAVGNGREDLFLKPVYPACFDLSNIISVGSVNADTGYSYYSNYNMADISALGREVISAIPGGEYGPMTGTSMSAAKVSGGAGVILSYNNTLNPIELADELLYSADNLTHLYNKVTQGCYLNIDNALAGIPGTEYSPSYEDDFDVHGYTPTPEENWALFSALGAVQVAGGNNHSLVLMEDGTVWAWGSNIVGQCGNGATSSKEVQTQVVGLTNVIAIAAGDAHSLALKSDGTVWAWGSNGGGQLGDGTTINRTTPVQVKNITGITGISAGGSHSLALKSDGTVWAWGHNGNGQLGDGTTTNRYTPKQAKNLTGVVSIAAGHNHNLALKSDGTVWAWGYNYYGQIGDNTTTQRTTPAQVNSITGVIAIAAGGSHSLALKTDGTVWAWGYNFYGQLGDGTATQRNTPVQSISLTGIMAIAAGSDHSLALKSNGTVWAWGYNFYGQLGDGSFTKCSIPLQIDGLSGIVAIATRYHHSFAINSNGFVWAWGYNFYGQLGDRAAIACKTPLQLNNFSSVMAIAARGSHSLALKLDGTVWAWGANDKGQLGDGTNIQRNTPVQVSSLAGVVAIAAGGSHNLALKQDGTVWAWGLNSSGQLGDGTTMQRITPVQVNNLTGVMAIAAGGSHSLALKSDGTVWAWGNNSSSQLGDNTTTNRTNPVKVSSLTGAISIAAGGSHSLALKLDGTVWAWGYNYYGQLGDNTTSSRSTPVQVNNLAGVTIISAGSYHSLALKSDGTVWAWGCNKDVSSDSFYMGGQLGDGTTNNRKTPVQVSNITGVIAIAAGVSHSMAAKSDSTVWVWGADNYNQLGHGRVLQSSIPIQVCVPLIPVYPDRLEFDQNAYHTAIPAVGSTTMINVHVVALDFRGKPVDTAVITYSLTQPYTGVSINSTTGEVTISDNVQSGTVNIEALCDQLTESAVLTIAIPDSIVFNQGTYSALIMPPGRTKTITITATALDTSGAPLLGGAISYSLDNTYTGVNINSATGVIIVDSTASPGIVGLVASYNSLTTTATLNLITYVAPPNSELTLSVNTDKLYSVSIWAYDITDFDGLVFTVEYDEMVLEVDDLCYLTWPKELTTGVIPGTGVTITDFIPGEITFTVDKTIPNGMAWTGIINAVRFKALDSGATMITIYEETDSLLDII